MNFCFFGVQTGDGATRQNRRCRNKIVKNPLVFIVFSDIDAVKRHLVERVLIGQNRTSWGRFAIKTK